MVFDLLYYALRDGKNYLKSMDKLHKFSSGIIENRRFQLEMEIQDQNNLNPKENSEK